MDTTSDKSPTPSADPPAVAAAGAVGATGAAAAAAVAAATGGAWVQMAKLAAATAPTPRPLGIYYDRWQALSTHIDKLVESYKNYKPAFKRQDTILHLLNNLQEFAKGQFEFFYYGFDPTASPPVRDRLRLQTWDAFPPEDVLTGLLIQVQNDIGLIQLAASQRIFGDQNSKDTLDHADHLAWLALQPAIDYKVIKEPGTVLTHFGKSAEFYSIPYGDVAIIAIPFTCVDQKTYRDYLAIPHEVGHYVYRQPTDQVKGDLDKLRLTPPVDAAYKDWIKAIFEELCADIYGCLVAGPVMAADFQSLSLANSQVDFQNGDGQHPNPALRPLVYCEVLANPDVATLVQGHSNRIAAKLASAWNQQLLLRHLDKFVIKAGQAGGKDVVLTARPYVYGRTLNTCDAAQSGKAPGPIAQVIHDIVAAMLTQLGIYVSSEQPDKVKTILEGWEGWAGAIDDNTDPAELFDLYRNNFNHLLTLPEKKPLPPDANAAKVETWQQRVTAKNKKLTTWPRTDLFPSGEVKNADLMEPNTWGSILYANGWTTSGPGDDPGHPGDDPGHPGDDPGHPEV